MPPKKQNNVSKKAVEKKKDKQVEDKTFGLKNKNKSKNVQKYIQEVTKQVKGANTRADRLKEEEKKKKLAAKAQENDIKSLFALAITQPKVRRDRRRRTTRRCRTDDRFVVDRCRLEWTPSRCSAPFSR